MLPLLLLSCTPPAPDGSELRVADGGEPSGGGSSSGSDSAGDTGIYVPADVEVGCGGDDGWAAVDDALAVDSCRRLTPEAGSITDVYVFDSGTIDTAMLPQGAPPPCGFTNLVGAVGASGTSTSPTVLYCDADADGGVRLDRYDPATDTLASSMLAALDCVPTAGSGDLEPEGEGWVAAWAGMAGLAVYAEESGGDSTDGNVGVAFARLDSAGALVEGPRRTAVEASIGRVDLIPGSPVVALAADWDGGLWALAPDGEFEPTALPGPATAAAGLWLDDQLMLAVCAPDDGALTLHALDSTMTVVATSVVDASACGWASRPAFVSNGTSLALAWDGGDGTWIAGFDASLQESWRTALSGMAPAVVADDNGWLTLTNDGQLTRLDSAGAVVDSWWHPGVAGAEGSVSEVRLASDGERLTFLTYGLDSYPFNSQGHVNTFNYLELTSAPLP